jgi:hypothetical protein
VRQRLLAHVQEGAERMRLRLRLLHSLVGRTSPV